MKEFSILDHIDKLTVVKELPDELHCYCPVCGDGGFKINKTSGLYNTFKCGCMDTIAGKKAVLEAVYPQSERPKLSNKKHRRPKQFRTFDYRDRLGNKAISVFRTDFGDDRDKVVARSHKGVNTKTLLPYRSELLEQQATSPKCPSLFITEGEPKTDTLTELFPNCVAINGIGGKWFPELTEYVVRLGYKDIILCPDKDKPGLLTMGKVAKQFREHNIDCHWLLPELDSWKEAPPDNGVDVVDWVADGAIAEDFLSWVVLSEHLPDWLKETLDPSTPPSRWDPPPILSWLQTSSIDEDLWLIEGFLSLGSNMLVGKSSQGKSILATQLAVAVSTGKEFLGRKVKQGKVLYHTSDEPEKLLKFRLNTQELAKSPYASNFLPLIRDLDMNRWSINYLDGLEEQIKKHKPKLVVIDSLRSAIAQPMGIKETDEEIGQYLVALKDVCEQHNVALLLIHHQRKNSEGDALDSVCGHNSIASPLDCIWSMRPDLSRGKEARKMTMIKNRMGEDFEEINLMLDPSSLTYNAPRPHNLPATPETTVKISLPGEGEKPESPEPETLTVKKRIEQWFTAWKEPKNLDQLEKVMEVCQVSRATIRKYVNELVKEGILKVVPSSIPKTYILRETPKEGK